MKALSYCVFNYQSLASKDWQQVSKFIKINLSK